MEYTSGSSSGTGPSTGQGTPTPREDMRDVKTKAQEVAQQAKGKAQQTAQKLKEQGKQQIETGKDTAAQTVEQVADAVSRASDELHQQQQDGLADYASQLAAGITRFADTLRNRSIDDLIAETQSLARRNPTAFLLGSVGVGFALSRFLKASSQRNAEIDSGNEWTSSDDFEVSYNAASEWREPGASQSVSGASPSATSGSSDFGIQPGSTTLGTSGWSDSSERPTNPPGSSAASDPNYRSTP
jgi:uncharacterized phage infection (PIP) family protein YhgE